MDIRAAFREQARACRELESPFMVRLCELFAERLAAGDPVAEKLLSWPADGSALRQLIALRVAGALHAMVLRKQSAALVAAWPPNTVSDDVLWSVVRSACSTQATVLLPWLERAPQTNEIRRSSILTPGFLAIAERARQPLMVSEIGASAGINLHWDHYHYRLGSMMLGDGSSGVQLEPKWQGPLPPAAVPRILERAACDLFPIDPGAPDAEERLLPYIWADQFERLARTHAGLRFAASRPERVTRADVLAWLPQRLESQPESSVHVICHTIVWQYMDENTQESALSMIEQAGAGATESRALAWLSFEADNNPRGAALHLPYWRGDIRVLLARADFHDRWIEWTGWQQPN